MMQSDEIPRNGILVISVHFSDYKRTHTNDARRTLMDTIPAIMPSSGSGAKIHPLRFSVLRAITDGVTRGSGVVWQFGYSGLDKESFPILVDELKKLKERFAWWASLDVICGKVVTEIE